LKGVFDIYGARKLRTAMWAKNISLLLYLFSTYSLAVLQIENKNDLNDEKKVVDQFNGCVCTASGRRLALV